MRGVRAVALLIALPGLAAAQEPEAKAVQRVVRNFGKLRGYAVTAEVEGGQARGADHRITNHTVNTTYSALVLGTVCRVDAPRRAFRPRAGQGGAVEDGVRWCAMLATDDGRRMERLFTRPEAILAECLRLKGAARWVTGTTPAPAAEVALSQRDDDDDQPRGTKTRDKDDDPGQAPPAPASNHLRIVGPQTLALEHFTRIQNSGCFTEG
ncbi:MAG: hypothetical protein KF878_29275 [Planctomycetes bacterium]|nr:hypothetical protein [Planctomycetota bacterium]